MEGDLIKVTHTFKLADVAHGNLVAQKKEFWGVIHAFTEPAKKWGLQRVKASDRRVRCLILFECRDDSMFAF